MMQYDRSTGQLNLWVQQTVVRQQTIEAIEANRLAAANAVSLLFSLQKRLHGGKFQLAEQLVVGVELLPQVLDSFVLIQGALHQLSGGYLFLQHFLVDVVVALSRAMLVFLIAALHKIISRSAKVPRRQQP